MKKIWIIKIGQVAELVDAISKLMEKVQFYNAVNPEM